MTNEYRDNPEGAKDARFALICALKKLLSLPQRMVMIFSPQPYRSALTKIQKS